MKYQVIKDLKKAIILLVVIFSVASCGKEETFSCDPEANMWVKSNITEIKQMSRADFLAIGDIVKQRAAFNAFTTDQRQALWIGKMEEVLKLDWTEQESQFIQSILKLIKVESFIFSKDRDQEAFDKIETEFYKWTEYALEELGWDKKLLYALIGTPQVMNVDKTINAVKSNLKTSSTLKSRSESSDCDCNTSWDTQTINSFCWSPFTYCRKTGCNEGSGCGWLWAFKCDGNCV